ncbi:MAG: UbiD family decarboxylase [Chloroflexi bacterium]|nr:UbiD family decarboxylase [Chloroflexota bacterium]
MAYKNLREWIGRLESEGELSRVKTEVDWDEEIGAITRKVYCKRGPALLFENIKDHKDTISTKLFTGGLQTISRLAMMLGMPKEAHIKDVTERVRQCFKNPMDVKQVKTGPVKENVITGADVDLYQFPVPKWHYLDGGRYINTFCGVVTKDPETGITNVGLYRGMILSKNKIGVLLVPGQGWGIHYLKYQELKKPMPVAIVYGYDDALVFSAAASLPRDLDEYRVTGALRGEPVELVKCETVDLEVPAEAEIVVEGYISPNPDDWEMEGPFGEYTGYYGESAKRPVIEVSCITHRNEPIFRGTLEGMDHNNPNEDSSILVVSLSAIAKNILESQGVPGVLEVSAVPITFVKIKKLFRGHAKQVAAALWGSSAAQYLFKFVIVVEEDTNIWNRRAVEGALSYRVNAAEDDIVFFPGTFGSVLDPSTRIKDRDEMRFGTGKWTRILIDATRNWDYEKVPEWGGQVYPPSATALSEEQEELVNRRWREYGID